MTHEEAARILDPETSREYLDDIEYYGGFRGDEAVLEAVNEACRIAAEVLRNRKTGEALTLEQLLEMDGQPVYCGDRKEWGVIHIDPDGPWANATFFRGVYCDLDVQRNGLSLYAYPPAHIDREAWVSVEERLPDDNERVIAYRPNEADVSAYKYCVMWGWSVKMSMKHRGISHWMPLPEPPAELEKRMGVISNG